MARPKPTWSAKRGEGQCHKWLVAHVDHDGDACLIWPFFRMPTGYGSFGYLGNAHYAHRFMCELVKGPPPTSKHYASHECGKGHEGCVHPKHIDWKTPYDNAIDRLKHGNNRKAGGPRDILNAEKASEIRALKGVMTQYELAAVYKVSRETISSIHTGRGWAAVSSSAASTPETKR